MLFPPPPYFIFIDWCLFFRAHSGLFVGCMCVFWGGKAVRQGCRLPEQFGVCSNTIYRLVLAAKQLTTFLRRILSAAISLALAFSTVLAAVACAVMVYSAGQIPKCISVRAPEDN